MSERYEDDEEEKEGLTFGEICHRIWVAKGLFFIVWAALFALIAIVIQFGYTKPAEVYTATVRYNFKGASNGHNPDGSTFDYTKIISSTVMQTVKDEDAKYSGIDIDKILQEGDISISETEVTTTTAGTDTVTKSPNYLTFSVKAKYFASNSLASSYIDALLSYPSNKAVLQYDYLTYDSNLTLSKAATQYTDQISYLQSQYDYLTSSYDALISAYGNTYVSSAQSNDLNLKSMSDYKNEIVIYFANHSISLLQSQVNLNGYVKNYDAFKTMANTEIQDYQKKISDNQKLIDKLKADYQALKGSSSDVYNSGSAIETKIAELETQNSSYQTQIDYWQTQLDKGQTADTTSLDTALTTYTDQLTAFTSTFKTNATYVYKANTSVQYGSASVTTKSGGMKIAINLVVSLFGGLVISGVVAGIRGNQIVKAQLAAQTAAPQLAQPVEEKKPETSPKKKEEK
jgi:uncharacterized protein YeeX (DUF496 family)